ncbi:hypothetical protein BH23ACT5_BH23ACT5_04460 [soil metagenome]
MTEHSRHQDIRELLGVHALGATEDFESRAVMEHVAVCDTCLRELEGHIATVERLPPAQSPGPDLWRRIERSLTTASTGRGSRLLVAALIAVVAGLAVQTARVADLNAQLETARGDGQTLDFTALATGFEGRSLVLIDDDGREMAVVTIAEDGRGIFTASAMGPPSGDRIYQLWAVLDGEVISAGLLADDPHATAFRVDTEVLEALVITEEEPGGVPVSSQPAVAAWSADA